MSQNPVWKMIDDLKKHSGLTEITLNGPESIFAEQKGKFMQLKTNIKLEDIKTFAKEVAEYNEKEIGNDAPILDGLLPDGSRVNIIDTPYANSSPAITIRRFEIKDQTFGDNPEIFGLNSKWINFFKALVKARMNIVVSGGTACGKTTFLNLLLKEVDASERLIVIEDTLELQVTQPNAVRLEYFTGSLQKKLGLRDLVKNSLRMRPDRIIVGETRGGEFFDLLQAMNTGHEGSLTSIHANSAKESFNRMKNMLSMAAMDISRSAMATEISNAINFVIQLGKNRSGERFVSSVFEVTGVEGEIPLTSTIAECKKESLKFTGIVPKTLQVVSERSGLPLDFFD